jgi:hypothetical protein
MMHTFLESLDIESSVLLKAEATDCVRLLSLVLTSRAYIIGPHTGRR